MESIHVNPDFLKQRIFYFEKQVKVGNVESSEKKEGLKKVVTKLNVVWIIN